MNTSTTDFNGSLDSTNNSQATNSQPVDPYDMVSGNQQNLNTGTNPVSAEVPLSAGSALANDANQIQNSMTSSDTPTSTSTVSTISASAAGAGMTGGVLNSEMHPKKGFSMKLMMIIGFGVLFLILASVFAVGVSAAYDMIKLPGDLNNTFSNAVSKIGFLPKSNKMLMGLMEESMNSKNSMYIDLSMAVASPELAQVGVLIPGFDKAEIVLKGPVEVNGDDMKSELNLNINNLVDLDLVSLEDMGYFKINKLPGFLDMYVGAAGMNSLKNKWVKIDYATLNSDASKALDANAKDLETKQAVLEKKLEVYMNEKILPTLKQSSEKVDNFDTYKLDAVLTEQQTEDLFSIAMEFYGVNPGELNNVSGNEMVKFTNATYSLWIDKKDYVLRKFEMTVKVETSLPEDSYSNVLGVTTAATNSQLMADDRMASVKEATIAIAGKFSKHGEKFDFKKPSNAVGYEEYLMDAYKLFTPMMYGQQSSYSSPTEEELEMLEGIDSPYAEDMMGFE